MGYVEGDFPSLAIVLCALKNLLIGHKPFLHKRFLHKRSVSQYAAAYDTPANRMINHQEKHGPGHGDGEAVQTQTRYT
jgi:hypothetical protein